MRTVRAFWIISTLVTCCFVAFPITSFAGDNALAKASYLPDELKDLPPEFVIGADYSGYWAGEDAPLVRCIQVNRPFSVTEEPGYILPSDDVPLEVVPGVSLIASGGVVLFYYIDASGAWVRIGEREFWFFGLFVTPIRYGYDNEWMLQVFADISGNIRATQKVYTFRFVEQHGGGVALRETTIEIDGLPIVATYQRRPWLEPYWVAFPTMGVDWEGYGPFSHADSPDRYILLEQDEEGAIKNVSASHADYYVKDIAEYEMYFQQSVASLRSRDTKAADFLPSWQDNIYMSYAVKLIIRYHDMGKHDEGVRRAREVIERKHFSSYERYQYALELLDQTVTDLEMQDKLIAQVIADYHEQQRAKYW